MAKSKGTNAVTEQPAAKNPLVAATNHFDPTLAALFASSSGPVNVPAKPTKSTKPIRTADTKTSEFVQPVQRAPTAEETSSEDDSEQAQSDAESVEEKNLESTERPRKRRRLDVNEDLESQYLNRLLQKEEQERQDKQKVIAHETMQNGEDDEKDSDLDSDLQDISDSEAEGSETDLPKHESLTTTDREAEAEKHKRTAFLGNVAVSAIKSKPDKKTLLNHLKTALDEKLGEKVESIRFRSTAFVSDAGPKRAAYAKKELMEETMKSTNAYVVLSSEAAVRKVTMKLNGTIVLDRHLRVDNLAHPSKTDHRRCIFVGNLSFVDEATSTDQTNEGERPKKRAREPADAEEGLWRTFGKVGKVESVRVVRDKETRISKGFAYVQFENENSVEAALLMNEKKFPPLLPRILRVTRAKKEMKSRKRDGPLNRSGGPRANGRFPKHMQKAGSQNIVFEGHRATKGSGGGSKVQKRAKVKPNNRSSKRAAVFKASGGKKKRDSN